MSRITTNSRMTVVSPTPPSTPRLRMESTGSPRTLLDGGWWPRSTDPVAELPGLVLAIDQLRGPVTRLVLAAAGWDHQPRRLSVADRVLRLGYFTSQPVSLVTALCDNGDRVDLLVIPPHTASDAAEAAMTVAATTDNLVHARDILVTASTSTARPVEGADEHAGEAAGGHVGAVPAPA